MQTYARDARILGQMDISNGYVDKIYGNFSPRYRTDVNALVFPYAYFDLYHDNETVLSFPEDPNMYITDDSFDILESFGVPGRQMSHTYQNVAKMKSFYKNWQIQSKNS